MDLMYSLYFYGKYGMSEKCPALERIKKMGLISVLSFGRTVFNPVCSVVLEFYIIVLVFILVLTLTEFSVYFLKIKCKLGFKKKKKEKNKQKTNTVDLVSVKG